MDDKEILKIIKEIIKKMKYGRVILTLHQGKITTVEKVEKYKLE